MDKNIGIIKEADKLGRIVIPKEFRERLCLTETVELILTDKGIIIRNPEYELVKRKSQKSQDFGFLFVMFLAEKRNFFSADLFCYTTLQAFLSY